MTTQAQPQHDDTLTEAMAAAISEVIYQVPWEIAADQDGLMDQARKVLGRAGLLKGDGTDGG